MTNVSPGCSDQPCPVMPCARRGKRQTVAGDLAPSGSFWVVGMESLIGVSHGKSGRRTRDQYKSLL